LTEDVARTITPPRVPAGLAAIDLGAGGIHDDLELEAARLTGAAPGLAARSLELSACHLQDVDLGAARLPRLALRNCRVSGGNLANVAVRGGVAERTSFEGVRLTGLSWHEGVLRDVTFRGCRIDLASFAASRLERVRFEDCTLAQSDLQDARLAAVRFEDCNLNELDLAGARLTAGCELRGCTLEGARGVEHLRGARMPYEDVLAAALTFAGALGIGLLDEEEDDVGAGR
jgi:uncharacterized protein YjbI with pentapeptide repeats